MKLSHYLYKTEKTISAEEKSINAQLLLRGGFVDQVMAGVYTFLPMGWRVMKKIEQIIREEMEKVGANEIFMPSLQPKAAREKTGRRDTLDSLIRFTTYWTKNEYALGPTHEEVVTPLMKKFIASYKDLPKAVFQIQNKFRDERRAKSGLLRGREFLVKDCYSFHTTTEDLDTYYQKQQEAYKRIFERVGIGAVTYMTYASGGSFSKYSHEYQTVTDAGEDIVYYVPELGLAFNKEIIDDPAVRTEFGLDSRELIELKTVEVGNIFKLSTKYSTPFELAYTDHDGKPHDVIMGCYGIGLSRLMGTVVEVHHDGKGIIWPDALAPFQYVIVPIGDAGAKIAEDVYIYLLSHGKEVVLDDRNESVGSKLKDADLIGYPVQIIVSDKTLAAGTTMVEYTDRKTGDKNIRDYRELI